MIDLYGKLFLISLIPAIVAILIIILKNKFHFSKTIGTIAIGIIYGLIAIFGTEFGVSVYGKAVANARDAAPMIAGLVFGGKAAIIAGIIGGVERFFAVYWGAGTYTRIACTVSTILAGFFAAFIRKHLFNNKMPLPLFGLISGIVIETFHMSMVLFTHMDNTDTAFSILRVLSLPMIVANSFSIYIAILIIHKIFIKDKNKFQSDKEISTKIQKYILVIMLIAFAISSLYTYTLQTNEGKRNAETMLKANMRNVESFTKGSTSVEDFLQVLDTINVSHVRDNTDGLVAIFDENKTLLSGAVETLGKSMDEIGIHLDEEKQYPLHLYEGKFNGTDYFYIYDKYLNQYIITLIPTLDVFISRDNNYLNNAYIQITIYAVLFFFLYIVIKKIVVEKIHTINSGLTQITQGNLDVKINVTDTNEFESLSNDINLTVDSIKRLMEEEKERMAKDLNFAKKIQSSSLPSVFPAFPNVPYFDIYATMNTAKEVGGDFYDFYFCDSNTLTFLIADVSGKGVPAAMFMMTAKTMIKNYSTTRIDLAEIITKANDELCSGNDAGMFVTSFIGQLNTKTGHIDFVNCGHNPPVLIRNKKATYLDSKKDFVLAGLDGFQYQKQSLDLNAGDRLYLYTDGVTEATNDKNELYGEPRLINLFNDKLKDKDIYETLKAIQDDINVFVNGAEQADDITMLEIVFNGGKK